MSNPAQPDDTVLNISWAKLAITGAVLIATWSGTLVGMYYKTVAQAHQETNEVAGRLDILLAEKTALVQKRDEQMADKDRRLQGLEAWKEQFASATTVRFGQIDSKLDVTIALLTRMEKKLDQPSK